MTDYVRNYLAHSWVLFHLACRVVARYICNSDYLNRDHVACGGVIHIKAIIFN